MLTVESIVLHDARGPAAAAGGITFRCCFRPDYLTRPPTAMLESRSFWRRQLTTADFIFLNLKTPDTFHTCGMDVGVFLCLWTKISWIYLCQLISHSQSYLNSTECQQAIITVNSQDGEQNICYAYYYYFYCFVW